METRRVDVLDDIVSRHARCRAERSEKLICRRSCSVILVSFVHFGITSLDYQRKGRSWWIFRKISRPSGKFIVSKYVSVSTSPPRSR